MIIIKTEYSSKKLIKTEGITDEKIPIPIDAPQIDAPMPQNCKADKPKVVVNTPSIELFLTFLKRIILSLRCLKIQTKTREKEIIKNTAIIDDNP